MRADIHDGQEHKRFMQGPDTDAQDQHPPKLTFGLQRTAGPYSWVIFDQVCSRCLTSDVRSAPKATGCRAEPGMPNQGNQLDACCQLARQMLVPIPPKG